MPYPGINKNKKNQLIRIGKTQGVYFGTIVIHSALPLIFLPVLTHYLAPNEYANIAVFRLFLGITNAILGGAFPTIIARFFFKKTKKEIASIIGNSIFISFVFAILLSAVLFFGNSFLLQYIKLPLIWVLLIPFISFAYVVLAITLGIIRN